MLTTTLCKLKEHGACKDRYVRLCGELGGEKKYGLDTELPLLTILEHNGLDDTLWALRACDKPEVMPLIAADFADHVLHIYEEKYPDDDRPRKAIEAARSGDEAARAAGAAAGAAAAAAAWAAGDATDAAYAARAAAAAADAGAAADAWAAWGAAWAAGAAARAARAAEREWQKETLKAYLNEEKP